MTIASDRQVMNTAAVLTPQGRGAVATIRVSAGNELCRTAVQHLFVAANHRDWDDQPNDRPLYGWWGKAPQEDVVLSRFGENEFEIHCHGGSAAIQRILTDLNEKEIATVHWAQQLTTEQSLFETECLTALCQATTLRTSEVLLRQQSGLLKSHLEGLHELATDAAQWVAVNQAIIHDALTRLRNWSDFGLHLSQPWKVAIIGRPNVGKSSLINRLLGYDRSIVFDQPGTTRDVVTGETALDGWPVRFVDTAGLRDATESLEQAGIARAREAIQQVDCRLLVLDLSELLQIEDVELLQTWPDAIVVANKSDLKPAWNVSEVDRCELSISTQTSENVDELMREIVHRLVPDVPSDETPVAVSQRQCDLVEKAQVAVEAGDRERLYKLLAEILTGVE